MSCTLLNEDNSPNKNMINLPHPVPDPCTGRVIFCTASKALQFWITTFPSMKSFPFQNLLPCLLIICIMDPNNIIHVLWCNVLILPTPPFTKHCIPEHLQQVQGSVDFSETIISWCKYNTSKSAQILRSRLHGQL